jgi:hypothetical protein
MKLYLEKRLINENKNKLKKEVEAMEATLAVLQETLSSEEIKKIVQILLSDLERYKNARVKLPTALKTTFQIFSFLVPHAVLNNDMKQAKIYSGVALLADALLLTEKLNYKTVTQKLNEILEKLK